MEMGNIAKQYQQTSEEIAAKIVGLVCEGCGNTLEPIETVDNSDQPTFWAGCRACSKFTNGASPHIFRIARRLVTEYRFYPYAHLGEYRNGSDGERDYWLTEQTTGAANIVWQVLHLAREETP
jgi:hypothetical protein